MKAILVLFFVVMAPIVMAVVAVPALAQWYFEDYFTLVSLDPLGNPYNPRNCNILANGSQVILLGITNTFNEGGVAMITWSGPGIVKTDVVRPNGWGFISSFFRIPNTASPGTYTVRLSRVPPCRYWWSLSLCDYTNIEGTEITTLEFEVTDHLLGLDKYTYGSRTWYTRQCPSS